MTGEEIRLECLRQAFRIADAPDEILEVARRFAAFALDGITETPRHTDGATNGAACVS